MTSHTLFCFIWRPQGQCEGFLEVLDVYNEITPNVKLGGPTNFAPLVDEAVRIVKEQRQVGVVLIFIIKLKYRFGKKR